MGSEMCIRDRQSAEREGVRWCAFIKRSGGGEGKVGPIPTPNFLPPTVTLYCSAHHALWPHPWSGLFSERLCVYWQVLRCVGEGPRVGNDHIVHSCCPLRLLAAASDGRWATISTRCRQCSNSAAPPSLALSERQRLDMVGHRAHRQSRARDSLGSQQWRSAARRCTHRTACSPTQVSKFVA